MLTGRVGLIDGADAPAGMVRIAAGRFHMGDTRYYRDESPVHERSVDSFWLDRTPVTNRQFVSFVDETGYVTVAERALDPAEFPESTPDMLQPGSLVFRRTAGPVNLQDWRQWWEWTTGASWRAPEGPGSDLSDRWDHPVVQVSFDDAQAYAAWAGERLPTEGLGAFGGGTAPAGSYPGGTTLANVGGDGESRRVLKGGSFLCSPDYCMRFRPAARSPHSHDTGASHIGFRCAMDAGAP